MSFLKDLTKKEIKISITIRMDGVIRWFIHWFVASATLFFADFISHYSTIVSFMFVFIVAFVFGHLDEKRDNLNVETTDKPGALNN